MSQYFFEVRRWFEHPDSRWEDVMGRLPKIIDRELSHLTDMLAEQGITPQWYLKILGHDERGDPVLSLQIVLSNDTHAVYFKMWFDPLDEKTLPKVHTPYPEPAVPLIRS